MDKKYLLTIDTTAQTKKPNKKEFKIISNNINKVVALTSKEIVRYSAPPYSYTFCPAILTGSRNNNNWGGQQIFMLDFDTGITPKVIIDKLLVKHFVSLQFFNRFEVVISNCVHLCLNVVLHKCRIC